VLRLGWCDWDLIATHHLQELEFNQALVEEMPLFLAQVGRNYPLLVFE
jgi:hypothetical protein